MNAKDIIKYLLPEEIYSVVTIAYLISLNNLNKQLEFMDFNNDFDLLQYRGYAPIKYFGVAAFLYIAGGFIIFKRVNKFRHYECSFGEIMLIFTSVVIIVILWIQIFVFIDNPILRAILTALGVGIGLVGTATEN